MERRGDGYTITLTDREYDALKDRIKAREAALWQLRERTKSPFLLDVIDKALASAPETACVHEWGEYSVDNAKSPADPPGRYVWIKCIKCGEHQTATTDRGGK